MSNWKEQFLEWLDIPRNRSRLIASVIGLFVLFGAVFFSTQIGNLLSLFGSKASILPADLDKEWQEVVDAGGEARAHGKLLSTNDGWLYVIGGMDKRTNLVENRDEIVMLNTVERIAIDSQTGLIMDDAQWEQIPSMNFGHAEFGVAQVDQYIYVVAGDIHIPPEKEGEVPLLYSTIERLDLSADPSEWGWEVTALLSGVNFYPEVAVKDGKVHVVGGVYGDPFPPFPSMEAETQRQDILNNGDANFGNLDLGNKPVFGGSGKIYLPIGYENNQIGVVTPIVNHNDVTISPPAVNTLNGTNAEVGGIAPLSLAPVAYAAQELPPYGEIVKPAAGDQYYMWDWVNIFWDTEYAGAESLWFQVKGESESTWHYIGLNAPYSSWSYSRPDNTAYDWQLDPANRFYDYGDELKIKVCSERTIEHPHDIPRETYTNNCANEPLGLFAVSDYFKINSGKRPIVVEVTGPLSGPDNILQTGEDATISWTMSPADYNHPAPAFVSIWLKESPGQKWKAISKLAQNRIYNDPNGPFWGNEGSFLWKVGRLEDGFTDTGGTLSFASIRVCGIWDFSGETCNEDMFDVQENISIRGEYWIENLATNTAEYFDDSRPVTITWDSHGANAVIDLDYQLGSDIGSNNWTSIARDIPAEDGKYYWHTFDIPDETMPLKIRASIDASWRTYLYSPDPPTYLPDYDYVTVTINNYDFNALSVFFEKPASGVNWEPGSTQTVKWHLVGIPPQEGGKLMQLYYSVNNGTTWISMQKTVDIVAEKTYEWEVPEVHADNSAIIKGVIFNIPPTPNKVALTGKFSIVGPEMSEMLSDALVSGKFVTTVGEHIVITPHDTTVDTALVGELGNDYISNADLLEKWSTKKVMKLGHLRFMAVPETVTRREVWRLSSGGIIANQGETTENDYQIVPVPQGRYGHKLTEVNDVLTVFGGASWFKEIGINNSTYTKTVTFTKYPPESGYDYSVGEERLTDTYGYRPKTFWVIDDVTHPFYSLVFPADATKPAYDFGKSLGYQFVGNIAMRLSSGTSWAGTNSDGTRNKSGSQLNADYSFKTDAGTPQGRAFFGFNTDRPNEDGYIVVGGLRNTIASENPIPQMFTTTVLGDLTNPTAHITYIHLDVAPSADTEKWTVNNKWAPEQDYRVTDPNGPLALYNLATAGLDGGVVVYGGQSDFQLEPAGIFNTGPNLPSYVTSQPFTDPLINHDPHVPMYPFRLQVDGGGYEDPCDTCGAYGGGDFGSYELEAFQSHPLTTMYEATEDNFKPVWNIMPEMDVWLASGFSAHGLVATNLVDNPSRVVYQYGGLLSNTLQALGAFSAGVPDPANITISPNSGKQNTTLRDVLITGVPGETHMQNASGDASYTAIIFNEPSNLTLEYSGDSVVEAGSGILKEISATFVDIDGQPVEGVDVNFNITGSGAFFPPGNSIVTGADGKATIQYRAPDTDEALGLVKISASANYAGVNYTSEFWMRVVLPNTPYELEIFSVSPDPLTSPEDGPVILKMRIYEHVNGERQNITSSYDVSQVQWMTTATGDGTPFVSTACFPESSPPDPSDCLAVEYTPPTSEGGLDTVIASMTIGQYFVSGTEFVHKNYDLALSNGVEVSNVLIDNDLQTAYFDIAIGSQAEVGVWQVLVLSPAVTATGFHYQERLSTTFTVELADLQSGPRLADITPHVGAPGAVDMEISILGTETNFDFDAGGNQRTTITFTSAPGNDNIGDITSIEVPASDITTLSLTELLATVSIPADARIGYWDVVVKTALANGAVEEAGYFGHRDFVIVPESGYILDMIATPDIMPRDGSDAIITGRLVQLNTNDGGLIPVPDVDVNLAFNDSREQGTLSDNLVTTDINGAFAFTYTVDEELPDIEPLFAIIDADATPEPGVMVYGQISIIKQNSDYTFDLSSDVSLFTVTPGQFPDPLKATLTATLIHPVSGLPINEQEVIFSIVGNGGGSLQPISDLTEFNGIAQAYYYPDQQIGNVSIVARAFVEGLGWVFSNSVPIAKVSSDTSRYLLELVASPTSVVAGGSAYSSITATIKDTGNNNAPMGGWPIAFRLVGEQTGDHLTQPLTGITGVDGTFHINFVPGSHIGSLYVVAEASLLPIKTVTINKITSQEVGYKHISAVPYRVPNNGAAHSIVTVTVKNATGAPLAGLPVTVATTQAPFEDIYNEAGTPIQQGSVINTNSNGRAVFSVASGWSIPHTTQATATINGVTISAPISFESDLVRIDSLGITVPTQARDYDYDEESTPGIWLAIREVVNSPEPYEVDEAYYRNDQKILEGLPVPFYLRANKTYDIWVKGKNHLASKKQFSTTTTSNAISVVFDELKAADLGPDFVGNPPAPVPWRDNKINTIDFQVFVADWGLDSFLADLHPNFLDRNHKVNTGDLSYWVLNFGEGSSKP
jgi:hypothetical protein